MKLFTAKNSPINESLGNQIIINKREEVLMEIIMVFSLLFL